jgi:hypothetical protein
MPVERLDPRVVAVVRAVADRDSAHAEIWRRARPILEARGLGCPSYGAVRRLVVAERHRRAQGRRPGDAGVHVDPLAGRIWIV